MISNLSELITTSYQNVVSMIAAGIQSCSRTVIERAHTEKFYEISRQECPKQNVKSLELIKTANTVVSIFFFILGLSCIALALLTYFVVPASFIRKLNRQAMKKLKAREMHDPFDDDDIDGDGTIVFAHESDEDTSSNDDDDDEALLNDTTGGSKHKQSSRKRRIVMKKRIVEIVQDRQF